MKISIIIPVYNAELYIEQCLTSILKQSVDNMEIICIDDGSNDNSGSIIKQLRQKDYRIKYFYCPHTNAANARNKGLEIADGDFILFLDADDFLDKDALYHLTNVAKQTNADIIVGQYKLFDNKTNRPLKQKYGIHTKIKRIFSIKDLQDKQFEFTNIAVWNKLYKSDFLRANKLSFKPHSCLNDMFFSLVAIVLAQKIALSHNIVTYYRINVKNSISTNKEYIYNNFFHILTEINLYLKKQSDWDNIKNSLKNLEHKQLLEFCARIGNSKQTQKFNSAITKFISAFD